MGEQPLISIITVNLNNCIGLERTMNSIFDQTYENFEYIVIDGGSTDGSMELIRSRGHNLAFWVSESDEGIYNAMNKGIRAATGEYLLFLNSGDEFFNNNVLEQNKQVLNTYDILYFDLLVKSRNKDYIKEYPSKLSFTYFLKDSLPHPSSFIKKSVFKEIGLYDEKLLIVSDWKFFLLAIFKYNCSYLKINKTLSIFYFDGVSSLPENKNLILEEKNKVLEENFQAILPEIKELNEIRGVVSTIRSSRKYKLLKSLGILKHI